MKALQFITAIPWNVRRGSGCYVGTRTLAEALGQLGIRVEMIMPKIMTPAYATTRLLFNESLHWRHFDGGATIGIDADGYAISRGPDSPPHIACIKGVLGDAVRFETGITRASLSFQASLEKRHARRADAVITVSRYCADRLHELYGVRDVIVVPELINLKTWRDLFQSNPAPSGRCNFTVLSVCRFYPRKRLEILLHAAGLLKNTVSNLEIRIVGNGPEHNRLQAICRELDLGPVVRWLGDAPLALSLAKKPSGFNTFEISDIQEEETDAVLTGRSGT
jgi:glycosyltransferase involved in cell wall biosynthesis